MLFSRKSKEYSIFQTLRGLLHNIKKILLKLLLHRHNQTGVIIPSLGLNQSGGKL